MVTGPAILSITHILNHHTHLSCPLCIYLFSNTHYTCFPHYLLLPIPPLITPIFISMKTLHHTHHHAYILIPIILTINNRPHTNLPLVHKVIIHIHPFRSMKGIHRVRTFLISLPSLHMNTHYASASTPLLSRSLSSPSSLLFPLLAPALRFH